MTPTELESTLRYLTRERRQRPEAPEVMVVTTRNATDTTVGVRVKRRVFIGGHHERSVSAGFNVTDRALVASSQRDLAAMLIRKVDHALAELDGNELLERLLADALALSTDTPEAEARVERAALKLMEMVEKARAVPR